MTVEGAVMTNLRKMTERILICSRGSEIKSFTDDLNSKAAAEKTAASHQNITRSFLFLWST